MYSDAVFQANSEALGSVLGCSIGWVVKDDKDGITLALDAWESGDFRTCETIARRSIDRVKYFKLGGKK